MHLYEVGMDVRRGFKVVLAEGKVPVVPMVSKSIETGGPTVIALGKSICRELHHPDDRKRTFRLNRADYHETTAGLMLVAQSEEQNAKDERALVLIDQCWLPTVPMTDVRPAKQYTKPEHLAYSVGDETRRDLFLFLPGNGVFVHWDYRLIPEATEHLRFILAWQKRMVRDEQGNEKQVLGLWQDVIPPRLKPRRRRPLPRQFAPEIRA